MNKLSNTEAREITSIVSRYFRIRSNHFMEANSSLANYGDRDMLCDLLIQIAADVDHSDLLVRLLRGEEPLDYEEWKNK